MAARKASGKLAAGFLVLAFVILGAEKAAAGALPEFFAKMATLSFLASFVCAIVAVFTRSSRVAGVIVLVIDAAIIGLVILVLKTWHLP